MFIARQVIYRQSPSTMASREAHELLSPSARGLQLSATLEINELVRQKLDSGDAVVHLGFGEATFPMQKDVLRAHQEASSDTSYLPVAGLPILRKVSYTTSFDWFENLFKHSVLVNCKLPSPPTQGPC